MNLTYDLITETMPVNRNKKTHRVGIHSKKLSFTLTRLTLACSKVSSMASWESLTRLRPVLRSKRLTQVLALSGHVMVSPPPTSLQRSNSMARPLGILSRTSEGPFYLSEEHLRPQYHCKAFSHRNWPLRCHLRHGSCWIWSVRQQRVESSRAHSTRVWGLRRLWLNWGVIQWLLEPDLNRSRRHCQVKDSRFWWST